MYLSLDFRGLLLSGFDEIPQLLEPLMQQLFLVLSLYTFSNYEENVFVLLNWYGKHYDEYV